MSNFTETAHVDYDAGMYATLWTDNALEMWFFARSDIPDDLNTENPDAGLLLHLSDIGSRCCLAKQMGTASSQLQHEDDLQQLLLQAANHCHCTHAPCYLLQADFFLRTRHYAVIGQAASSAHRALGLVQTTSAPHRTSTKPSTTCLLNVVNLH